MHKNDSVHVEVEKVMNPKGATYANLVMVYTRWDGRSFSLKIDPILGEELVQRIQEVLPAALLARQEAIAETAQRRAEEARQRLAEGAK